LSDPNYQLRPKDQPKYARFKGAENHSVSIDHIFLAKTSSILSVFDILYTGEVGLAPLHARTRLFGLITDCILSVYYS
jgi:hypothetical protein